MDVIRLSRLLSTTNLRSYRDDDFWVDRLSHRYSVVIFTVFAVLVTTKAYIGDPIDCWAPPEFKASYERYAETLCFVNGTYYISPTEVDIPSEPGERYSNRVRYYQWTPFILLLQAFFMFLPRVIWLSLNTKYGIHLKNLVDAAKKYESVDSCSNREKIIAYLCRNLLRSVKYREYKANKKVLNVIKKNMYLNHQLELNSLLTMMSVQPNLTANVLRKEPSKKLKKSKARMKPSRSFDDLHKSPFINEFYSKHETGNECRLKFVTFKTTPDQTLKNHRPKSSRSHSSQNLVSGGVVIHNPAYYIIDPKLDTKSLIEYLNNSMVDGTKFRIDTPLNLLQAKITSVSHKHLLSMLTSCYQVEDLEPVDDETRAQNQIAYLINSDVMRRLEKSNSSFESGFPGRDQETLKKKSRCGFFNLADKYLSTLYVVVKFFYFLSGLCQLVFLNRLIGNNFYILGLTLIKTFFHEIEWPHLDVFPRMTLCEIYIREVGTTHPYLIQCVLRINLFNEVIFVFVWYWLLLVIILTGLDLVREVLTLFFSCSNCNRKLFALKYLELVHLNTSLNQLAAKKFAAKLRGKKKVDVEGLLARANPVEKNTAKSGSNESIYYDNNLFLNPDKPKGRPMSMCSSTEVDEYRHQNTKTGKEIPKHVLSYLNHKYMLILASDDEQFELFERFCSENFNNDTIFSLRVIEQNASSLIVSEIVEHLWTQYKALNCVYSSDSNDYLLKKLFVFNDLRRPSKARKESIKMKREASMSDQRVLVEKL